MSASVPTHIAVRSWLAPTALLASRSIAADGIVAVAGLAVARLYAPSEVGAAGTFIAAVGWVSLLAALRYDLALAVVPSDSDADRLLVVSVVMVVAVAALVGSAGIIAGDALARGLHAPAGAADLRFAAPLAIAGMGLVGVGMRWSTRHRQYALMGRVRVRQGLSQSAGQIGFGMAGFGAWGLAAAGVAGSCAGGRAVLREPLARVRAHWPRERGGVLRTAWRYRKFSALSMFSAACQGCASGGLPVLIAAFYGIRVAGLYVLAARVVAVPARLIGNAVARTYIGDAALLLRTDPAALRVRLRQTAAFLGVIALVPALILAIDGPAMFSLVFGGRWRGAGELARSLSVLAGAQLVVSPLLQSFAVLARMWLQAGLAALQLVLVVGPIVAAHAAGAGPAVAAAAMSSGGVLCCGLTLFTIDRITIEPREGWA